MNILPPQLLGTAGPTGCMIYSFYFFTHVGSTTVPWVYVFSQREGDNFLSPIGRLKTDDGNEASSVKGGHYIFETLLPNEQKGLQLEANEKLYVAFGENFGSNVPVEVVARGGHY